MFIYFACSITGGREDQLVYQAIVDGLLGDGHEIPTAHLAKPNVLELEAIVDPVEVYTRDVTWINASDALIAEVSTPSHGVGYEIAYALERGKPVLCCHRYGVRVSKMITGNLNQHLRVTSYQTPSEAFQIARTFLEDIRSDNHIDS